MKKTLQFLCIGIALCTVCSCASIVSKSSWPVDVGSSPAGAKITITNRRGMEIYKGVTPALISLKSGAGFFKKESYTVKYELEGYDPLVIPLECKVNGWYWGNIIFGGLLGMLIIDPATGAMYKLNQPYVDGTLKISGTGSVTTEPSLKICTLSDIPKDMQSKLVKIK